MSGLNTMDDLVAGLAGRPIVPFNKVSMTAKGAGYFQSLWTASGFPAAGAAAGSANGLIPTNATTGSLSIVNAVLDGNLFLAKLGAQAATVGTLIVYDRLWTNSALNGTLTTAQTWTQPALTRHTDGEGVEAWLEVYTATGSTAVTATLSYTNSDGVSGRSATASIIASPVAGQLIPFNLAAGDSGVKATASVTLSATTGTAGNFGITLMKRKCEIPFSTANIGAVLDAIALGIPTIYNNACIAFMVQCSTTSTGYICGTIGLAEGAN